MPLNSQFKKSLELLTENGALNYAAYLLADENGVSIKVAKYRGTNRVDLIENNEYGCCSLIKATKSVLDKIELENRTATQITSKERIDRRLWNPVAIREAIINSIVHNDFTREVPPKFEIFADRIEITSAGTLPEGLNEDDFFDGVSIPRNRELMRVYRDLELVEQLGSGVPRILESYGKECFRFMGNFIRMTFPVSKELIHQSRVVDRLVDGLVESQRKIVELIKANPKISKKEMAENIEISTTAVDKHIRSLREKGILKRVGGDRSGHWELQ